jgi:hypothetical protein
MRCDLSIVATSRNDDHGGNLLGRMQLFINGLLAQCRRHDLSAELILVEWNPPDDKPGLAQALSWPVQNGPCKVRIIEVPAEIHNRFEHSDQLPLFQLIAKNVGIRRARAPFVLATNIDILFSDELMQFLAGHKLNSRRMYRLDRHDVPTDIPAGTIQEQLAFCRQHVLRVHKGSRLDFSLAYQEAMARRPVSLAWRDWRIWPVTNAIRGLINRDQMPVKDFWLLSQLRLEALQGRRFPNTLSRYFMLDLPVNLHTNGSGDFTILDSQHWQAVRGYPEFTGYCMHVDALLCYVAHHAGALEKLLTDPMRIYHIEHGTGSGDGAGAFLGAESAAQSRAGAPGDQEGNSDPSSIPRVDFDQMMSWATEMRRRGGPMLFNSEAWGLAGENLRETVIDG